MLHIKSPLYVHVNFTSAWHLLFLYGKISHGKIVNIQVVYRKAYNSYITVRYRLNGVSGTQKVGSTLGPT